MEKYSSIHNKICLSRSCGEALPSMIFFLSLILKKNYRTGMSIQIRMANKEDGFNHLSMDWILVTFRLAP
jgi:hypothetical protein